MTVEGAAKVFEDRQAVFAQGGDLTANAGMAAGPSQSAEAAGNLEADFHHAKSALGLVVCRRMKSAQIVFRLRSGAVPKLCRFRIFPTVWSETR